MELTRNKFGERIRFSTIAVPRDLRDKLMEGSKRKGLSLSRYVSETLMDKVRLDFPSDPFFNITLPKFTHLRSPFSKLREIQTANAKAPIIYPQTWMVEKQRLLLRSLFTSSWPSINVDALPDAMVFATADKLLQLGSWANGLSRFHYNSKRTFGDSVIRLWNEKHLTPAHKYPKEVWDFTAKQQNPSVRKPRQPKPPNAPVVPFGAFHSDQTPVQPIKDTPPIT